MSQAQTIPAAISIQNRPLPSALERMMTISRLAFPISLAQSSVLIMALIDLAMVGRLGTKAVAAFGLAVFTNRLVLAAVDGLTSSVRGIVARRRGEGSSEPKCLPLNAGLFLAFARGVPLAVICTLTAPYIFPLISSDSDITSIGTPVLRVLCLAVPAIGMHNAFNGHWTGLEKPRIHMLIILFTNCLNTLLNYALIFGHFGAPALGPTGAAIGTATALSVGVIVQCVIVYFTFPGEGFLTTSPGNELVKRISRLGLPINITSFFFGIGYVVFLWLVGEVGTAELAAANVLVRITMILVVLASSLGMASATLVSRTVGEGDLDGAERWGWSAGKLGVFGITLLGLPILLFPRTFLAIFLSDPHTIAIAVIPVRLEAALAGLVSLIYIFGYMLNSLGEGKQIMIISLSTQWLLFLPAIWFIGPHLHYGMFQLWLVNMGYSLLATVLITRLWIEGRWKKIKL